MKKTMLLIALALLTACSTETAKTEATTESVVTEAETEVQTEMVAETETEDTKDTDIIGKTMEEFGHSVTVNSYEFVEPQWEEAGKILALDVTYTNNSEEPTSPWMAMVFKAEQETDTTIELLDGGFGVIPDDYEPEKVEMATTDVKPGATVDAVIPIELLYDDQPVFIRPFMDNSFEYVIEQ